MSNTEKSTDKHPFLFLAVFLHIKVQYGCLKGTLNWDFSLAKLLQCLQRARYQAPLSNSFGLSATKKYWGLKGNHLDTDLVELKTWNVKLICLV